MKEILKINLLGEFVIEYGENVVTDQANRSKKVWSLLEYLVVNRDRAVSQDELIKLLWSEGTSRDPINTLKVLMHRVRTTLNLLHYGNGSQMIVYSRGAYGWNPENECEVDVDEFERFIHEADQETRNTKRKIELLLHAESIYKGNFLQKNGSELWIVPIANYYHSLYTRVVFTACELLIEQKRYDELANLCKRAIVFEQFNEKLYIYMIQAYVAMGQSDRALEEYQHVSELFFREFGITPSEELVSIYKDVVKTIQTPEMNLEIIKEKLNETDDIVGSYFCEYEFFKSVYRLEARSAARTGQTVYIALITVTGMENNEMPNQKTTNRVMDSLKSTIHHTLRKGDIFTRYSVNQYLIMLPTTTFETSNLVMSRIVKSYKRDHPHAQVLLRYTTQPITPNKMNS